MLFGHYSDVSLSILSNILHSSPYLYFAPIAAALLLLVRAVAVIGMTRIGIWVLYSFSSVLTLGIPRLACSVPQFPEEDSKLRATALQVRRGGNCPNTAEVLQQLLLSGGGLDSSSTQNQPDSAAGVVAVTPPPSQKQQQRQQQQQQQLLKLHLVSILPNVGSPAIRKILSSFATPPAPQPSPSYDSESLPESVTSAASATATSVDFSHSLYRKGHDEAASSYIIRSGATGSRTIVNYNDLPEMTTDEFMNIADDFVSLQHNHSVDGSPRGFSGEDCWWHFEVGSAIPVIHMLAGQSLHAFRPAPYSPV